MKASISMANDQTITFNYDPEKSTINTGIGVVAFYNLDEKKMFAVSVSNPNIVAIEYELEDSVVSA